MRQRMSSCVVGLICLEQEVFEEFIWRSYSEALLFAVESSVARGYP